MPAEYAFFKVTVRAAVPLRRAETEEILQALANAVRSDAVHPPLTTFTWTPRGQPSPVLVSVETR
jgi:hypothetical protein